MGAFGALFTKNQVFMDVVADDAMSLIEWISEKMVLQKLVTKDFIQAVKDREKMYPTGLPTLGLGVAIPHTEAAFVTKESFSVSLLRNPILFQEMGNSKQTVLVHIVFMLALKDNHTQLSMLQGIVSMIQKPEFLQVMYDKENATQVYEMIVEELKSVSME